MKYNIHLPRFVIGKSPLERALWSIGRRLVGGYRTRIGSIKAVYGSKNYRSSPTYGKQEAARRLSRMN